MAGKNTVEIILSAKDEASKAMAEAFGQISESHNKFLGGIISAKTLIAGAFGYMGKQVMEMGIDYDTMAEQSTIAWTTLLGSQEKAKQMITDIGNLAKATPFETEQVDMMAKYFFNAGINGKALIDQVMRLSDVSSAFNVSADNAQELARQMSQVDQAGVAMTSDLDILQNQGIPIFKALGDVMHVPVAQVKKLASEGKITADLYNKAFDSVAAHVKGASDAQSQTFGGMLSTLSDNLKMLSGALAMPLFDALKKSLNAVMPLLSGLTTWAKGGGAKEFTDALIGIFGTQRTVQIGAFIKSVTNSFDTFKTYLEKGKASAIDFFNSAKSTLGPPLTKIFGDIGDIGGAAFKDIEKFAKNAFEQIKSFWDKDGNKIMAALKQAFDDISAAVEAAKPVLKAVFDIITTVGIKAFNQLMDAIKFVSDHLNVFIPIAAGAVAGIAAFKIIETVVALMQSFVAVTKLLDAAWIALDIVMDANPIGLIALAIGVLIAAGVALYQNWDAVKNKMQVIWMEIKAGAQDAMNGIIDKINDFIRLVNKIPGVNVPIVPKVNFDVLSSVRADPGTAPKGYGRAGGAQQAYASGTDYAPGGVALVGENGPELMYVPRGAQIKTTSETQRILGGTTKVYNVTVNPLTVNMNENDLVRTLQRMERMYNV